MERIARWDRPLEGRWDNFYAWCNMIFVDHGIFRVIYLNQHEVAAGFYRAAQPTGRHVRAMARQGIRSIVNRRGGREHGSWPIEKRACDESGISLVDFVLRSRGAPDKDSLLALPTLFEQLQYPVLVHCKSGADRAGLMSALYLLIREERSAAEARRQLSWRFGHFKFAKTGILDSFIDEFERSGEQQGLTFIDWVRDRYDPEALEANFRPSPLSTLLVDTILRRE